MWFYRCIKTDFVATNSKFVRLDNELTFCAMFCIRLRFDLNFFLFFSNSSMFQCLKLFFSSLFSSAKMLFITSKFRENLFILLKSFNEPMTTLWFDSFDFFFSIPLALSTSIVSLRQQTPDTNRPPVLKCCLFEHWTEHVYDDF